MRTIEEARAFAAHWVAAWNARDLVAVLSHYADDMVFYSPRIEVVTGQTVAFISSKAALSAYWGEAFRKITDLKFTLDDVYVGRDTITIAYRNQRGQSVAETLIFNDQGLAHMGIATYR